MARNFRIKGIEGVTRNIKKVFKDSTKQRAVLDKIGKFVRDRNVATARSGKSLSNNIAPVPLPELKDSTIAIRQRIIALEPWITDPTFFRVNKSNVTFTGQLLDSLKYRIKSNGDVVLFFKDRRVAIKEDDLTSNNAVYDKLVSIGFDFLGLDEKGQDRVKKLVLDEFRRNIKKLF